MNNQEYFEFLDELRKSGDTNMFGAAPYLVEEFEINKYEARKILAEWMETFDERQKNKGELNE